MDVKFHSAVVFVNNLEMLKAFYQDVLQLEVEYDFGNNMMFKNGFSLWQVGTEHQISKFTTAQKTGAGNFELYFETEQIHEVVANIEQNDLIYIHQLIEEPWGQKTMRFYDPEQNIVEIAESLFGFVSRMKQEGLSMEAIVKKTGIPINEVVKILKE